MKITPFIPYNNGSLRLEGFIKAINTMSAKWLIGKEDQWPYYLQTTVFAYSTFQSPNLNGLDAYQLI